MGRTAAERPKPPRLDAWNDLLAEVQLPADFSVALTTGRPELLRAIDRALTAKEARMVANALAVLIETNRALQEHAIAASHQVQQITELLDGASAKLCRLSYFASFVNPDEIADEED